MTLWRLGELDIFFLSYDEPGADRNYEQLCKVSPREPIRIHRVKGLHRVHARATKLSRSKRFITVDADSFVHDRTAFDAEIDDGGDGRLVFAFRARNAVNGLVYGNGSVKCYPKQASLSMRELASAYDFHAVLPFLRLDPIASTNCFATSPYQAFRGGYREAVKLSLDARNHPEGDQLPLRLSPRAKARLTAWISVGADAENGLWAIYGARRALIDLWVERSLALLDVNDFDYLQNLWAEAGDLAAPPLAGRIAQTAAAMARLGLDGKCLSPAESARFKQALVDDDAGAAALAPLPSR